MLSPNFYMLVGAIESARVFIDRCYRDWDPSLKPKFGIGPDPIDNKATGDTHLDPLPGKVSEAAARLPQIRDALLNAEGDLSIALYEARLTAVDKVASDAWEKFRVTVTNQSFIFAKVVRRLMWEDVAGGVPPIPPGTGAPEWEMMDLRLRRILTGFAAVGLGGGEDDPASNGPGILGSSDESFSY